MRKVFPSLFLLLLFISISCITTENPAEPEVPEVPEVVAEEDTYNYIALRNDGQLYEIGNNTGKVKAINKIPGIDFNILINGITASDSRLFIYEHKFDPFQAYIHEYNKASKTNKTHKIAFPENEFGAFAGLISMEFDEEKEVLVALVKENFEENYPVTSRIAQIDPVTFEVTSLNIEMDRGHIMGTLLLGNNIYTSTYKTSTGSGTNEFFAIDLESGSINTVEINNMSIAPIHLSHSGSKNSVFGFLPVQGSSFLGESEPVVMDLATGMVTLLLQEEITGTRHQFGRSFYHSDTNEHVDIITSPTYIALLRYNSVNQKVTLTKIPNPDELSSFISLVGVVKSE